MPTDNKTITLAAFDLDNTLIAGDSDFEWGQFLCERGIVDRRVYEQANARFFAQYEQGTLDIQEFLSFALQPLADNDPQQLQQWRDEFITQRILPMVLPAARDCVDAHREQGHCLLVITSTNSFVTAPIAGLFDIPHLIATEPEQIGNRYTGNVSGQPSFGAGKVTRLQNWLETNNYHAEERWFYSDSHNDLPLLEQVEHPVAVDADDRLTAVATEKGWQRLSWRR